MITLLVQGIHLNGENQMGNITKLIFIKNAVETLGYFSGQLAAEMERLGFATYFIDYDCLFETVDGLARFAGRGDTALVTFNFIGLRGEEVFETAGEKSPGESSPGENSRRESGTVWEKYGIAVFNILVDHPLYYHKWLVNAPSDMKIFCIDREHVAYMKRFYRELPVKFLPLAGNVLYGNEAAPIPYEKRKYDIVFTGNYTPVEHLYREIDGLEADYRKFYREIIEDLIANPNTSVDNVMEAHIRRELGEIPDTDKRSAIAGMVFVDICVRSYFRGEIIRRLAESGVRIHVFGANWEKLCCDRAENIISTGREVDSKACVEAVRDARISLNIMPWFKDGAHDRVLTAMLQGTVALTDDSRYLREEFTDGEDIVFFSLEERESLPELVHGLLGDEERAKRIAENGCRKAREKHTWRARARELQRELGE